MPIADKKKILTFIGVAAQEVARLQASATRLERLRTLWAQHNPDVTGSPLEGVVSNVSVWIDAVRGAADNAVANGLLAHVSTGAHRNMSLGEEV